MDSSPLGALLRGLEMEVDPAAYDDGADAGSSSGTENSSSGSNSGGSEGSDLESMTGRGIQCLCSELLELKKSSDKDFQKNLYSNYSTFIRVFREVGDVESELMELKRHVSDQQRLGKDLMESFCMDSFSEFLQELMVENDLKVGNHLLTKPQTHFISIIEKLDILSVEHRFEEALDVLETEEKTLQKIDREGYLISAESFASHRSALSELRIGLADRMAAMAGHPRVTAPELQKLLLVLCRLGESCQANSLLIQFYHTHLVNRMHELQHLIPLLSQMYVMGLAKTTFSVISQAARSYVMLFGETSPYGSEFMMWVTDEIEMFSQYFDIYIKSIYEMNGCLHWAVEGLKHAFSFCSLLKPQRLVLQHYLIKSIQPCMKEVLQIHVDYLRKTIHIFTETDTWILDKFLVSEITRETTSPVGDGGKQEYCLLTSSGRKFVTLIQAILDNISPLCNLQMESSILGGLAGLFNEYIKILECSIPSFGNSVEKGLPRIGSAQKLSQQLSLLVNTWTLVDYLLSIAKCIFEGVKTSNDEQILVNCEASRHNELECWIFSIQYAADQLRGFFCRQFVDRYISATARSARTGSEAHMKSLGLAASSQAPMPSSEFQMFFQQLCHFEKCGKSVFGGADEKVEKLLKDLVDTAATTISSNVMFWRDSEHSSPIQQSIWFKQLVLDMHFLVEIPRFGGYSSHGLVEASRSLVANMENAFLNTDSDTSSAVSDDAWASAAAKAALQKLVEIETTSLEADEKCMNASEEGLNYESAQASSEHDVTEFVELSDREVEIFTEVDIRQPQNFENQD